MKNLFSRLVCRVNFNRTRRWWLALLCPLMLLGGWLFWLARAPHTGAAAQGATDAVKLSEGAQRQIKALLDEKAARTPAQQKLDSQLLYALKMRRGAEIAPGVRQLSVRVETDARAKTVVDITAIVGGTLLEDIETLGAELISVHAQYNSLRANAPLDRLEEIAALAQVRFIQPKQEPQYLRHVARARERGLKDGAELPPGFIQRAQRVRNFLAGVFDRLALQQNDQAGGQQISHSISAGSRTSEGDVTHRAEAARTIFGANGAGVRIGVLSDGVLSLAASQASGDLPLNVVVLPGYTGDGDEGTAMLEIINDLAPGAQLYFATADGGVAGFAQAIRDLRAAGCDIIVDDVRYVVETPLQDGQAPNIVATTNGGVVTQAVNDVTADGALYFASQGNAGNKNDNTAGVWEGDFVDGGTLALAPGGNVHNFGGGAQFNTINSGSGSQGASLYWADPLGAASNDYDLFVLNSTGTALVASSTNIQNGTQDPFEFVAAASVATNNRLVVLKKTSAANRFFHLSTNRGQLLISTPGQTRGHNCAANAFSVAATPAANASGAPPNPTGPFPNPFNSSNTVELFSSDGPRRLFFNANGTAVTPGDFSATGGLLRQKPDITAADGVMVTGAGGFPTRFFGTSAAAPHAAAIAGLLKSFNPLLTPTQVRNALTGTAIDIEGAGVDRDSGAGIVMAFQALQAIGAMPAANLQIGTVVANEAGGNGNSFIESGEGGALSVQLLNNGPLAASGVTATLSTTTPGVTVTTPNSTYPNLPATTGAGTGATPFAFTLSAAAVCPLRVDFFLTASFAGAGSPKVLPFTVQTGVPPLTITSTLDTVAPASAPGFTTTTGLQTLRLNRTGQISVCGVSKDCPGTTGTGTRRYDAYTFTNCSTSPSCVSANFSSSCSGGLFVAAYLGSFNPNNVCANYLADPGLSPGIVPINFGLTVPAGATFTLVVHEVNSGGGLGCNYTLNLAGLCCQAGAGACPTVTNFAPAGAAAGGAVTLNGANLTGVTGLSFANGVGAGFTVNAGGTQITTAVPSGATSGPISLSKPGCADVKTASFIVGTGTPAELFVDDGTFESAFVINAGTLQTYVNRLSPFSYPATLTGVSIFIPNSSGPVPVGTSMTLLAGNNADGDADINNTVFQTFPATTQTLGQFTTYNFPAFTITSGDFVVGYRITTPAGVFPAARDTTPPLQRRSYFSANGTTFTLIDNIGGLTGNLGVRARIGSAACPTVSNLNPASAAAGTQTTITGANFQGISAVKFANNVTATFNVVNDTTITAIVPNSAVSGPITISKPGCPDVATAGFIVTSACPTVTSRNPASGSEGSNVTITGNNFVGVTAVNFANNVMAPFTINNVTTITAIVPAGAVTGPITLSKPNCTDVQTANFTFCSPLIINPATLPNGTGGTAYNQTLTASGGTSSYSFAVTAGALPGGLTLAAGGVFSGTPNVAGTFNFTVTATDANGCTGTHSYTVNITVTLSAQTRALYILNESTLGNTIYGYAVNEMTGALTLLQGFPIPTGGKGDDFILSERLTIDRTNQRLYAINSGSFSVSAYAINPTTGALTSLLFSPIKLGSGFWTTIAMHPSGSPLVVGDGRSGRLASYQITAMTATAAADSPYSTGSAVPLSSAFSQDGNFVYTGANSSPTIAGFSVNAATGTLTALAGSPFDSGAGFPIAYATDASGRLFVANSQAGQVSVFTTASGIPSAVPGNPFLSGLAVGAHGLLHQNGFYLVVDRGSSNSPLGNRVGVYRISGSGSATTLAAITGSPFATGGSFTNMLALNQTGTFLFAANGVSRNLTAFSVNLSTGALTAINIQPTSALGFSGLLTGMAYFAQPCPTITLSPNGLPGGTVGTAYNQTVSASPSGNYNFSITAGALPAGLSLNAATGAITGTPTTAGTANFTITALSFGPCSGSQAYSITINNPAPTLAGLNPASATAGGVGFTLTVTGANFVNGSVVRWNNSDRLTTFVSNTQLTAAIPASDIASAGTANLTVFSPAPGGGTSGALSFTINNPTPATTGLNPASAIVGGPGFTLTVNGTGFVNGSVVRWNGSDRPTTFVSSTQLSAAIPASDISSAQLSGAIPASKFAIAATANVTVFNPAPGGGTSNALTFTINNPVPALTVLNPNAATVGGVGFTLTLTGTNFINGALVRWNGGDRATAFVSSTQLTAFIPAADIATAGTNAVTVFNPAPGGGTSNTLTFTVNNPAPTLAGLNPSSAIAGGPGLTLTLTGTNFVTGSVVRWNGADRITALVLRTQLTAQIPASDLAAAGTASVTVFNSAPGGGTSNALSFTINNLAPSITSLAPSVAIAGSGAFTLTVNGTNFVNDSGVRWNGGNRATTFVSATRLTAAILAADIATAGTARVTVFNSAPGGGASNEATVTIANALANVSAASFARAELAVESIVAAFGTGLATSVEAAATTPLPTTLAGTTVRIRDSAGVERLAPLFFVAPSQINYLLPLGTALGTAAITVTSGNGTLSAGTLQIAQVAPGLFAANANGQGVPAALALRVKADGTQSIELVAQFEAATGRFTPAPLELGPEGEQVFLILFGTGFRAVGALANVTARIGGGSAEVLFAGAQGDLAGLDQANVRIPRSLAGRGEVEVVLTVEGKAANTVRVNIR